MPGCIWQWLYLGQCADPLVVILLHGKTKGRHRCDPRRAAGYQQGIAQCRIGKQPAAAIPRKRVPDQKATGGIAHQSQQSEGYATWQTRYTTSHHQQNAQSLQVGKAGSGTHLRKEPAAAGSDRCHTGEASHPQAGAAAESQVRYQYAAFAAGDQRPGPLLQDAGKAGSNQWPPVSGPNFCRLFWPVFAGIIYLRRPQEDVL